MSKPPSFLLIAFLNFLAKFNLLFFPIKSPDGKRLLKTINQHKKQNRIVQTHHQAFNLIKLIEATNHLSEDMAEIGVFRGGSAKLILEHCNGRRFHLFDTYEGLPEIAGDDDRKFEKGDFSAGLAAVKSYIGERDDVIYHVGVFPDSTHDLEDRKYSFVHIDVDLVDGTRECLKYFYPRMCQGGVILSQDYGILPVRETINEFFEDQQESVIEILNTQCFIVKL